MPWMDTTETEQRRQFVRAYDTGLWTMTELCERFGISRPTGYKWVDRWRADGAPGLADRSSAPHVNAQRTDARLEAQILAARQTYGWGAGKLRQVLRDRHPRQAWPTRSTINAILDRHGVLR